MKITLNTVALVLFFLIQLTSCRKKDVTPPVQLEECRITEMIYTTGMLRNIPNTATFNYNEFGNPVSVIVRNVGTANPHAFFFYDQQNRLTDYIGAYTVFPDPANMPSSFVFEYWIRYVYADQNPSSMPVRDTLRTLGRYTNGHVDFLTNMSVKTLNYDSQGRIIQGNGYDSNGNLITPNATYDNKKNYRRTNKVWMLIDENYSVNNPFMATAYNAAGFPTTVTDPATPYSTNDIFLFRHMKILALNYSCTKGKSGK